MVLHAFSVASVKLSCGSILKSFVSEYDELCNVSEETANEQFLVVRNGYNLANADRVVSEALELYWEGKQLIHLLGPPLT